MDFDELVDLPSLFSEADKFDMFGTPRIYRGAVDLLPMLVEYPHVCDHGPEILYTPCPSCFYKRSLIEEMMGYMACGNTAGLEAWPYFKQEFRHMTGFGPQKKVFRGISTNDVHTWTKYGDNGLFMSVNPRPSSWSSNLNVAISCAGVGTNMDGVGITSFVMECLLEENDERILYDSNEESEWKNSYDTHENYEQEIILTDGKWPVKIHFIPNIESLKDLSPAMMEIYIQHKKYRDSWTTDKTKAFEREREDDEIEDRLNRAERKSRRTRKMSSSSSSSSSSQQPSSEIGTTELERKRPSDEELAGAPATQRRRIEDGTEAHDMAISHASPVVDESAGGVTEEPPVIETVCEFSAQVRGGNVKDVRITFQNFNPDFTVRFNYNYNVVANQPDGQFVHFPIVSDKLLMKMKVRSDHYTAFPHACNLFRMSIANRGDVCFMLIFFVIWLFSHQICILYV